MIPKDLQETIDKERNQLIACRERLKVSKYLKNQCEIGLLDLEMLESIGNGAHYNVSFEQTAAIFLKLISSRRESVEEAINKYGEHVIAAPDDLKP